MGNYFDYVIWRGDLPFSASPLNEVDITIFAMSPLVDLSHCLEKNEVKPLHQAYDDYEKNGGNTDLPLGLIIPNDIIKLFGMMARSTRFKDIMMGNYERRLDVHHVSQFAAHTVDLAGVRLICFSGTDDTTVGWEENFNMMIKHRIPAQQLAVKYLQTHLLDDRPNILVGHSKGGNLAMYSFVHSSKEVRDKIEKVYNLDGPGTMFEKWDEKVCEKIIEIIPQDSTIGRLFNHYGKIKVVKSTNAGLNQHDSFSWEIKGSSYVETEQTAQCKVVTKAIKDTIDSMTEDERKIFVDVISRMFQNAEANTLTELDKKKSALIKSFLAENPDNRKFLTKIMLKLFAIKEVRDTVWQGIRENQRNVEAVRKEKALTSKSIAQTQSKAKAEEKKKADAEKKRIEAEKKAQLEKLRKDQQAQIERLKKEQKAQMEQIKKEQKAQLDQVKQAKKATNEVASEDNQTESSSQDDSSAETKPV